MSEAERRRRDNYKKNRKKWIFIQAIVIAVVTLALIASAITYYSLNKTYYIDYTEQGDVDYKVQLKPNDYYEEEWIGKDKNYVSTLIQSILAEFSYKLNMGTKNVDYEYSYRIDAIVNIADKKTGEPIYSPVFEIIPEKIISQSSNNKLAIKERVSIDYEKFNTLANNFVTDYKLTDTENTLKVVMSVEVVSSSSAFESSSANEYDVTLSIPLVAKTVDINILSAVPDGENKVLAYTGSVNQNIFKVIAIVTAIIDVVLAALLVAFIYVTRNEDINYTIKVNKGAR